MVKKREQIVDEGWMHQCEDAYESKTPGIPDEIVLDYVVSIMTIAEKSQELLDHLADNDKVYAEGLEHAYDQFCRVLIEGYFRSGYRDGVKTALAVVKASKSTVNKKSKERDCK